MIHNVAGLDDISYKLIMTAKLINQVFPPVDKTFRYMATTHDLVTPCIMTAQVYKCLTYNCIAQLARKCK